MSSLLLSSLLHKALLNIPCLPIRVPLLVVSSGVEALLKPGDEWSLGQLNDPLQRESPSITVCMGVDFVGLKFLEMCCRGNAVLR